MRVSEYYKLGRNQSTLDFVDIELETDNCLFLDPSALHLLKTDWGHQCRSLIQQYFKKVIDNIAVGNKADACNMLKCLSEPNETRLGYSVGRPSGRGLGQALAERMWNSLKESEAVSSGILENLEDTVLMVDGISRDMISDTITNLIRGKLIEYTAKMCKEYGIPTHNVTTGKVWDGMRWREYYAQLPVADGERIVFVPRALVRKDLTYKADEYYNLYILNRIQDEHVAEGMVRLLKNGDVRPPTKKSLIEEYGKYSKRNNLIRTLENRGDVLREYRRNKAASPRPALSNREMDICLPLDAVTLSSLIEQLKSLPTGREHATNYERVIKDILAIIFYPHLMYPETQVEVHDGRKRIDIIFQNVAQSGFFAFLKETYCAPYMVIECKNYSDDPSNPELDQLSGRFSPIIGRCGLLLCRKIENRELFDERCRDTAIDERGYIIALDDEDMISIAQSIIDNEEHAKGIPLLRRKFEELFLK